MKKQVKKKVTETKCWKCGQLVFDAGPNIGQCSNPKCKAEHTSINPLPNDGLTDCQYKDFYG